MDFGTSYHGLILFKNIPLVQGKRKGKSGFDLLSLSTRTFRNQDIKAKKSYLSSRHGCHIKVFVKGSNISYGLTKNLLEIGNVVPLCWHCNDLKLSSAAA